MVPSVPSACFSINKLHTIIGIVGKIAVILPAEMVFVIFAFHALAMTQVGFPWILCPFVD